MLFGVQVLIGHKEIVRRVCPFSAFATVSYLHLDSSNSPSARQLRIRKPGLSYFKRQ